MVFAEKVESDIDDIQTDESAERIGDVGDPDPGEDDYSGGYKLRDKP